MLYTILSWALVYFTSVFGVGDNCLSPTGNLGNFYTNFRKKFPHTKQYTEGVDEEKIKSSELAATYFRIMLYTILSWALVYFTSVFGMGTGGATPV